MFLQSSLPVTVIFLGPREIGNTGWKTRAFFPHLKLTQGYPEPGYNISNGVTTVSSIAQCTQCALHATSPYRGRTGLRGGNLSQAEVSPAYSRKPGQANFYYISLHNLANRIHEKQVSSVRRVTRLACRAFGPRLGGWPLFQGQLFSI